MVDKFDVNENDYFILSYEIRKEAYQVMECWDNLMTVKTKNGCMDKPYHEYEKLTDTTNYKLNKSDYFEDNRTK
jgi:hypothetical protein